ncbi:hypothetical protein HWV62_29919 [Athelia sp. TMB]|nr:hypothetical protein HWV62_29919 [Athelia sp. TMB]
MVNPRNTTRDTRDITTLDLVARHVNRGVADLQSGIQDTGLPQSETRDGATLGHTAQHHKRSPLPRSKHHRDRDQRSRSPRDHSVSSSEKGRSPSPSSMPADNSDSTEWPEGFQRRERKKDAAEQLWSASKYSWHSIGNIKHDEGINSKAEARSQWLARLLVALAACYGEDNTSPNADYGKLGANPLYWNVSIIYNGALGLDYDGPLVRLQDPAFTWSSNPGLCGGDRMPRNYTPPDLRDVHVARPKPRRATTQSISKYIASLHDYPPTENFTLAEEPPRTRSPSQQSNSHTSTNAVTIASPPAKRKATKEPAAASRRSQRLRTAATSR